MKRSALYLRIIGLCVIVAVGMQYSLVTYSLHATSDLVRNGAGLVATLTGLGQIVWWLITLTGGIALLVPHRIAKWLLAGSLVLSLVTGVFVSWVPGAKYIGELIQSPSAALVVFYLVNGAILSGVFLFSRRAT